MLIDIRYLGRPVSDALHDFATRRVTRALRPFQDSVSRVDIRIKDVNGPRGGIDIECGVTVALAPVDQPVIIESEGADAYAAVMAATARLHEAVSRALGRGRRIPRPRAPVSGQRRAPVENEREEAEQEEAASDARSSGLVITETDQERLRRLIQVSGRDRDAAEALAEELDRAEVVPAERIAGDVVTMNSRVAFRDEESGENREVSLVYPEDSDPARGRISVLAPVGTALLGLSVGQTIDWPLPRGRLRRYRVIAVVYQPEAAGDLHL